MQSKYSNYAVFLNKGNNVKTKCYTYEVTMLVQVLADDETSAAIQLDDKGGYVSDRKVKLVKTTDLSTKGKTPKE
jgi:hypothetical protein